MTQVPTSEIEQYAKQTRKFRNRALCPTQGRTQDFNLGGPRDATLTPI